MSNYELDEPLTEVQQALHSEFDNLFMASWGAGLHTDPAPLDNDEWAYLIAHNEAKKRFDFYIAKLIAPWLQRHVDKKVAEATAKLTAERNLLAAQLDMMKINPPETLPNNHGLGGETDTLSSGSLGEETK